MGSEFCAAFRKNEKFGLGHGHALSLEPRVDRSYGALCQAAPPRHSPGRCALAGQSYRGLKPLGKRRLARQQRYRLSLHTAVRDT